MSKWQPKTLQDALENHERDGIKTRVRAKGKIEFQCPCGAFRPAGIIIDMRHVTGINQDFACDGCHSDWKRRGVSMDGEQVRSKTEWVVNWARAHNAPGEVFERIAARKPAQPYGNHKGARVRSARRNNN